VPADVRLKAVCGWRLAVTGWRMCLSECLTDHKQPAYVTSGEHFLAIIWELEMWVFLNLGDAGSFLLSELEAGTCTFRAKVFLLIVHEESHEWIELR